MTHDGIRQLLEAAEDARNSGQPSVENDLKVIISEARRILCQTDSRRNRALLAYANLLRLTARADSASVGEVDAIIRSYRYWTRYVEGLDDDLAYRLRLQLGNCLRIVGRVGAAIELLETLADHRRANPRHYLLLARAYSEGGWKDGFNKYCELSRRALYDGQSVNGHFNACSVAEVIGRGLMVLGRRDEAIEAIERYSPTIISPSQLWPAIWNITSAEIHAQVGHTDVARTRLAEGAVLAHAFGLRRQLRRCRRLAVAHGLEDTTLGELISRKSVEEFELITLRERLRTMPAGTSHWRQFQDLVVSIIAKTLVPPLAEPAAQVRTCDGRERMDITVRNDASYGLWREWKEKFGAAVIVVEVKNVANLRPDDFKQLSGYLDPIKGRVGLLVKRGAVSNFDLQHCARFLRKLECVVPIAEAELKACINSKLKQLQASEVIASMYRKVIELY